MDNIDYRKILKQAVEACGFKDRVVTERETCDTCVIYKARIDDSWQVVAHLTVIRHCDSAQAGTGGLYFTEFN